MEAIVLAGGLGTRLRPVVPELPKPLASVNGRPFLEHLLDYWTAQGVSRYILAVAYRHEAIERQIGVAFGGKPVAYSLEETPLGTGGGLFQAARLLRQGGPTLVLNGDTYFAVPLAEMLRFHSERNGGITIALFATNVAQRYGGVKLGHDNRVLDFEPRGKERDFLANGGVYLFRDLQELSTRWKVPTALSLETQVLGSELRRGTPVFGYRADVPFIDIGVPEDYRRAEQVLPQH